MLEGILSVEPISRRFGERVSNFTMPMDPGSGAAREIFGIWHEFGVIVLPGQHLSKDELVACSQIFGVPERAAHQERELIVASGPPQVMIVSNVIENGIAIGHLGNGVATWHTDMCYMDAPPDASMLYAVEVPASGGDTHFMDMHAVFERLPAALRSRIAGLKIKHDKCYTAVGDLRHGYDPVRDLSTSPGAIHPMIRIHPVTGRAALYLGRRLNAYVVGLSVPDSEELLEELWSYTKDPDVVWSHRWSVGDLVIWDNRCVMHMRDGFDQESRRIMWRTQMQPHS